MIFISKLEKLREQLIKDRQKAEEWQARAKDTERKLREQENLEIIQAVRGITASPEGLKDILAAIQAMKELPGENGCPAREEQPEGNDDLTRKEETGQNEEN